MAKLCQVTKAYENGLIGTTMPVSYKYCRCMTVLEGQRPMDDAFVAVLDGYWEENPYKEILTSQLICHDLNITAKEIEEKGVNDGSFGYMVSGGNHSFKGRLRVIERNPSMLSISNVQRVSAQIWAMGSLTLFWVKAHAIGIENAKKYFDKRPDKCPGWEKLTEAEKDEIPEVQTVIATLVSEHNEIGLVQTQLSTVQKIRYYRQHLVGLKLDFPVDINNIPLSMKQQFFKFGGFNEFTSVYPYVRIAACSGESWDKLNKLLEKHEAFQLKGQSIPKNPKTKPKPIPMNIFNPIFASDVSQNSQTTILDLVLDGYCTTAGIPLECKQLAQLDTVRAHVVFHLNHKAQDFNWARDKQKSFKVLSKLPALKHHLSAHNIQSVASRSYPGHATPKAWTTIKAKGHALEKQVAYLFNKMPKPQQTLLNLCIDCLLLDVVAADDEGAKVSTQRAESFTFFDSQNVVTFPATPDTDTDELRDANKRQLTAAVMTLDLVDEASLTAYAGKFEYTAAMVHLPAPEHVDAGTAVSFSSASLNRLFRLIVKMTSSSTLACKVCTFVVFVIRTLYVFVVPAFFVLAQCAELSI